MIVHYCTDFFLLFCIWDKEWEELQSPMTSNIQAMNNRREQILALLLESERAIAKDLPVPSNELSDENGEFEGEPFSASAFSSPTASPSRSHHQAYSIAESLENHQEEQHAQQEAAAAVAAIKTNFAFPNMNTNNVSTSFEANLDQSVDIGVEDGEQSSHGFFAAWGHDEHSNIPSNFSNFGYDDDDEEEEHNIKNYVAHDGNYNEFGSGGGHSGSGGGDNEHSSTSRHHTHRTDALYLHHSAINESRRIRQEEQDPNLTFQPQLSTTSKSAQRSHDALSGSAFDRLIEDAQRKAEAQAQVILTHTHFAHM
jgi:hypothetical protein